MGVRFSHKYSLSNLAKVDEKLILEQTPVSNPKKNRDNDMFVPAISKAFQILQQEEGLD